MGIIVALAGGVGAAKFLEGLVRVVNPKDVFIVGNTGDDAEFYGLHVCPDLDIVMYTLAGIVDKAKGWGIFGDTFECLNMLGKLGYETWFRLGDRDFAFHIARTKMLREGMALSQVTKRLCKSLGVDVEIVPMSDNSVRTKIVSDRLILNFQEYFVKRGTIDRVTDVLYEGAKEAEMSPGINRALAQADRIIICPSNPILSISPILSIPKFRDKLLKTRVPKIGISPIIGGKTIKGPADRIMSTMGFKASAYGVAEYYSELLDHFIIDNVDEKQKSQIKCLGMKVTVTNTMMDTREDSIHLAQLSMEA